jgi:hypothetical protein
MAFTRAWVPIGIHIDLLKLDVVNLQTCLFASSSFLVLVQWASLIGPSSQKKLNLNIPSPLPN